MHHLHKLSIRRNAANYPYGEMHNLHKVDTFLLCRKRRIQPYDTKVHIFPRNATEILFFMDKSLYLHCGRTAHPRRSLKTRHPFRRARCVDVGKNFRPRRACTRPSGSTITVEAGLLRSRARFRTKSDTFLTSKIIKNQDRKH